MTTFIEYFSYPFFIRALVVGAVMSLLLSWVSSYVVLRKEVLFTHALSNVGFLGIALAILFNLPVTPVLIVSCLVAAFLIRVVQAKKIFDNDSLLGIFSQIALALGIIVVASFSGYQVNIEQFLFGDILGVSEFDLYLSLVLLVIVGGLLVRFHKTFLQIALSDVLSHSVVKKKKIFEALFIFLLAILVAVAMKIVGVLLVAAFVTIPSNTAKLIAKNIKQSFVISCVLGFVGTLIGFYLSVVWDAPSGPLIVSVLGVFWALAIVRCKL